MEVYIFVCPNSEGLSTSSPPVVEAGGAALGVVFTIGTEQSAVLHLAASVARYLTIDT